MKSANEIGPSRAMRSRRRSGSEITWPRIIVSAVRRRLRTGSLAAACVLAVACSSRPDRKLPTYEDYSDGTSLFADRLLSGWKSGDIPADLVAPSIGWSGPLPGDGLEAVSSRPPLTVAIYAATAPGPNFSTSGETFLRRLAKLRQAFGSLGRSEATIFDMRRKGERREILLGLFL